jgi:hypothetical protein
MQTPSTLMPPKREVMLRPDTLASSSSGTRPRPELSLESPQPSRSSTRWELLARSDLPSRPLGLIGLDYAATCERDSACCSTVISARATRVVRICPAAESSGKQRKAAEHPSRKSSAYPRRNPKSPSPTWPTKAMMEPLASGRLMTDTSAFGLIFLPILRLEECSLTVHAQAATHCSHYFLTRRWNQTLHLPRTTPRTEGNPHPKQVKRN